MGEYAILKSSGERIKIGTCEQMYYLRADQVHLIKPVSGSVNPQLRLHAQSIRFRFPFPQEDGIAPGSFADYDYGLGLYGIEPPDDPECVEHGNLQFVRSYPESGGLLLSIPCPRSKAGKASGIKVGYNGYSGPVQVHSQRLVEGKLVLVLRCGDCGALYRVPNLEECQPLLDVLAKYDKDRQGFYDEIARRIVAGYTEPNYWTAKQAIAA